MIEEALRDWKFTRSETLELLRALDDKQLSFRPEGEKWQALAYQFACIGRTQMIYTRALESEVMDFAYFADSSFPNKLELKKRTPLEELLQRSNGEWLTALATSRRVKWPEHTLSVPAHVYRLISHERLHHGQLISYFTIAGFELPPRFKANWSL